MLTTFITGNMNTNREWTIKGYHYTIQQADKWFINSN